MDKTYKIKPLKWYHDAEENTYEATGVNYYYISEDTDKKVCFLYVYDDAGDFIRIDRNADTVEQAKEFCNEHYLKAMKDNLIEL